MIARVSGLAIRLDGIYWYQVYVFAIYCAYNKSGRRHPSSGHQATRQGRANVATPDGATRSTPFPVVPDRAQSSATGTEDSPVASPSVSKQQPATSCIIQVLPGATPSPDSAHSPPSAGTCLSWLLVPGAPQPQPGQPATTRSKASGGAGRGREA
jgi:hypothetical protein